LNLEIYYTSHFKRNCSHTGVAGDCSGNEISAEQHEYPSTAPPQFIFVHVSFMFQAVIFTKQQSVKVTL